MDQIQIQILEFTYSIDYLQSKYSSFSRIYQNCPSFISFSKSEMKPFQSQFLATNSFPYNNCRPRKVDHDQTHKFKNLHKAIIIGTIFGVFATYRLLYSSSLQKNCIIDNLHEVTFPLNRWIAQSFSQPFIGLGQIMMDINITCMLIYWYLFLLKKDALCKEFSSDFSIRFFSIQSAVDVGKSELIQRLTIMPFESYTVWHIPGFPTWTVEYGHTSDYFFSGHTGTLVLLYFEARKLNLPQSIQIYFIFTLAYMIFMLLVARVHYTIDIFGGFFFSAFFYQFTDRYLEFFDMIVNAPYKVIEIVKEKVKRKLEENADEGTSLFDIQHL